MREPAIPRYTDEIRRFLDDFLPRPLMPDLTTQPTDEMIRRADLDFLLDGMDIRDERHREISRLAIQLCESIPLNPFPKGQAVTIPLTVFAALCDFLGYTRFGSDDDEDDALGDES